MVNVHCVVHSLSLCTIQTAEAIADLKQQKQILADVFYYFHTSPKQAAKIKKNLQKLLEEQVLTHKELHSIRWLLYYNALQTVHTRRFMRLLTYFPEVSQNFSKDPNINGLKKKFLKRSSSSLL